MTDLPNFENLCCDWTSEKYKDRIRAQARFIAERHKIYIKRHAGESAPWTKDPILRANRFTNIYRELDRGTIEVMDAWIKPNITNENIAAVALLGRLINWSPTLIKLQEAGINFESAPNTKKAFDLFKKIIYNDGGKKEKLVTGAYIVNTVFPRDFPKKDGSKADFIANFFLQEVWSKRKILSDALKTNSFKEMLDAYCQIHGVGRFIANQAAVDLTYTKHLRSAKDINTTWSPGPGTCKGIRKIFNKPDMRVGEDMDAALTQARNDINNELTYHRLWSDDIKDMKTNIVPISAPNYSNCNCETSKHFAMAMGERDRMKNRYNGG